MMFGLIRPDAFSIVCIFDTDAFCVTHIRYPTRRSGRGLADVFEIVDKWNEVEVLLQDHVSRAFQFQIECWKHSSPTRYEVEDVLVGYSQLARLPLRSH